MSTRIALGLLVIALAFFGAVWLSLFPSASKAP
jgi:hypothetical protein